MGILPAELFKGGRVPAFANWTVAPLIAKTFQGYVLLEVLNVWQGLLNSFKFQRVTVEKISQSLNSLFVQLSRILRP